MEQLYQKKGGLKVLIFYPKFLCTIECYPNNINQLLYWLSIWVTHSWATPLKKMFGCSFFLNMGLVRDLSIWGSLSILRFFNMDMAFWSGTEGKAGWLLWRRFFFGDRSALLVFEKTSMKTFDDLSSLKVPKLSDVVRGSRLRVKKARSGHKNWGFCSGWWRVVWAKIPSMTHKLPSGNLT